LLGVATVVFWLSFLPYLPPITLTAEHKDLVAEAREAREYAPAMDRPQELLERELLSALRAVFVQWVAVVLLGTLSGVLLIVHPSSGRILAVALCSVLLLTKLISILSAYPHIGQRLHFLLVVFLPRKPVYVIHNEIIATVFYIATIIILLRAWPPNTYQAPACQ